MLISLYTVRVVLGVLGAEDYGVYNVVAGVVAIVGFLNGAMSQASKRFFSYEVGRGDFEQLKKVFSLNLMMYLLVAIIVIFFAETAGLWFVNKKLMLPPERRNAALWLYQFSIVSFVASNLATPYMMLIISREEMNIYACVSILEAALKLATVFILQFVVWDKLKVYGSSVCLATIIITMVYRIICTRRFKECKFSFYWNKELLKDIANYTGWSIAGIFAPMSKSQIVTVLVNQFFNPATVVARNIAMQISSVVSTFSNSFNAALHPKLIQNYAANQYDKMLFQICWATKAIFLFMFVLILPLVLEMPLLLKIWLNEPPLGTVLFTRLALVEVFLDTITMPAILVCLSGKNIKFYQSVISGCVMLNVPLSWIALHSGMPPYSVMVVQILVTCLGFPVRLVLLKRFMPVSLVQYICRVILPLYLMALVSMIFPVLIYFLLGENILRLCLITCTGIVSSIFCMYVFCLNVTERTFIKNIISKRWSFLCPPR
jgi:O-antigen/teichoic acid export membrane protein